jgi:uncharacterized RDD family membrane protein YckC
MAVEDTLGAAPLDRRHVAASCSLSRRFIAWLLDSAILLSPVGTALALAPAAGSRGTLVLLALLCSLVIAIGNDWIFVVRTGQSIGRRILGVRVVDSATMMPARAGQVLLRSLVGGATVGIAWHPIAALPTLFVLLGPWPLICYGFAAADRQWHRALNDRWSHTVAIDVRHEARI